MSEVSRVQAIERGRERRALASIRCQFRMQTFIDKVVNGLDLALEKRVRIATEYFKSRVIVNISRAVTKVAGARGRIVVTERSKKGEYPRADTTQLMKSVFSVTGRDHQGRPTGGVGTPLDYGAVLELSPELDRRWLTRTLDEERETIGKILGENFGGEVHA